MAIFKNAALRQSWFIISSLVSKDFKIKYRRSVLGILWSVLNPLLMMLVLTAVFSTIFRFEIENDPFYLILGNTLFALGMDTIGSSMGSVIGSASLMKKIRIDPLTFPVEKALFELVSFAVSLIAVVIVMLAMRIPLTFNLLLLPLLLVYTSLFSLGIGLALAALAVFFRDVLHIWSIVRMAWMYATPLFYPVEILPEWMLQIEAFNPMYHFVTYFREIALWGITPGLAENGVCALMAVVAFLIGLFIFRRAQKKFILYV